MRGLSLVHVFFRIAKKYEHLWNEIMQGGVTKLFINIILFFAIF